MSAWGRYRFLLIVYGLAALVGLREVFHGLDHPDDGTRPHVADVMLELYPDSADVQYALGLSQVMGGDFAKARTHFENALSTGVKTDENLLYYYALTLVRLDADPAEIDSAIANWRFNYPASTMPDPREALKQTRSPAPNGRLSSRRDRL